MAFHGRRFPLRAHTQPVWVLLYGVQTHERTISDTLGISDNLLRRCVYRRSLLDNLALADSARRLCINYRTVSDGLGLQDSVSRQAIVLRALSDSLGLSDSASGGITVLYGNTGEIIPLARRGRVWGLSYDSKR